MAEQRYQGDQRRVAELAGRLEGRGVAADAAHLAPTCRLLGIGFLVALFVVAVRGLANARQEASQHIESRYHGHHDGGN